MFPVVCLTFVGLFCEAPLKDMREVLSHSFTSWPDVTFSILYREHSMQSVWAISSSDFYQMLVAFLSFDHSEVGGNGCVMIR